MKQKLILFCLIIPFILAGCVKAKKENEPVINDPTPSIAVDTAVDTSSLADTPTPANNGLSVIWNVGKKAPEKNSYSLVVINNLIYAVTGDYPDMYLYIYDPAGDTWSGRIELQSKRLEPCKVSAIDDKIYVYHGLDPDGKEAVSIEEYDTVSNTSRMIEDAQEREDILKILMGHLYKTNKIPGSKAAWYIGPYYINDLEYMFLTEPRVFDYSLFVYNDEKNEWQKVTDLPKNRVDFAVQIMDNKILTIGGWHSGTLLSDLIEMYDPIKDEWSQPTTLKNPAWYMGSAVINNKLYIIGGKETGWSDDTGGYTDTVYIIDFTQGTSK